MAKPETLADHLAEEDAAFVAAVEDGVRSLDEGRGVPYEDVRRWLLSWGAENPLMVCRVPAGHVEIVRLWHGAQDR